MSSIPCVSGPQPVLSRISERPVDGLTDAVLVARPEVRVEVQRRGRVGVAEGVLHCPNRAPVSDRMSPPTRRPRLRRGRRCALASSASQCRRCGSSTQRHAFTATSSPACRVGCSSEPIWASRRHARRSPTSVPMSRVPMSVKPAVTRLIGDVGRGGRRHHQSGPRRQRTTGPCMPPGCGPVEPDDSVAGLAPTRFRTGSDVRLVASCCNPDRP
jgi:hypothetical protein